MKIIGRILAVIGALSIALLVAAALTVRQRITEPTESATHLIIRNSLEFFDEVACATDEQALRIEATASLGDLTRSRLREQGRLVTLPNGTEVRQVAGTQPVLVQGNLFVVVEDRGRRMLCMQKNIAERSW